MCPFGSDGNHISADIHNNSIFSEENLQPSGTSKEDL
jgi:hypothetical protein